jgi:hypothetical protein
VAVLLRGRLRGYKATALVERYRATAALLRQEEPEKYQEVLAMAKGDAATAAARDPDAFVALFLAAAEDVVREDRAPGAVRYSQSNVEDWDFRNTNMDSPDYDVYADLFLSRNFTTVVAINSLRMVTIKHLVESGLMELTDDGDHVRFREYDAREGAEFLQGMSSGYKRFSRDDRLSRKVVVALSREYRKNDQLRVTILPPMPGRADE